MSAVPAPNGLAEAGLAVWSAITGKYQLRPDELFVLEDACAVSDMIALLKSEWVSAGRPLDTKGSMGQKVIHPLIGEIRAQQAQRNALWRQLKLPDDTVGDVPVNQQRDAANSKWATGRGRGA